MTTLRGIAIMVVDVVLAVILGAYLPRCAAADWLVG
jgi:hypothetical protein